MMDESGEMSAIESTDDDPSAHRTGEGVDAALKEGTDSPAIILGAEFRRIRTQLLGVSQEQMARRLGVAGYSQKGRQVSTSRSSMSRLEAGSRTPSSDVLARLLLLSDQPEHTAELMAHLNQRPEMPDATTVEPREPRGRTRGKMRPDGGGGRLWLSRRGWLAAATVVAVAGGAVAAVALAEHDDGNAGRLPTQSWTETTGTPAHTWSDYEQASGLAGRPLGPRQSVQVSCRVRGYVVLDGDPWWYRIETPPWNGQFYATSDAFYNEGSTSGPVDNGVVVDEQIPPC